MVLRGNTVGYPSDIVASCSSFKHLAPSPYRQCFIIVIVVLIIVDELRVKQGYTMASTRPWLTMVLSWSCLDVCEK